MICRLTTTDSRTFNCLRCGRVQVFRQDKNLAKLRLQCGAGGKPRQRPKPAPKPRRAGQTSDVEPFVQRLLTTIRQNGGDFPPWSAIERYAKHVCETGAWSGCENKQGEWVRRVVDMAAKPGIWPKEWGEYPA